MDEEEKKEKDDYKKEEKGRYERLEDSLKKRKSLTDKLREKPWMFSTFVLGVLVVLLMVIVTFGSGGITGRVVSGNTAGNNLIAYLEDNGYTAEVSSVTESNGLYLIDFLMNGKEQSVYITKDGNYVISGLIPLLQKDSVQEEVNETILECVENYGIGLDTIIFYYSDSCGWCAKMKPGVEILEGQGYNIHWVEASGEDTSVISDCVEPHMKSSGVPQFICVKTGEIHVGAFTDENGNLDQEEMNEWAENCLSE